MKNKKSIWLILFCFAFCFSTLAAEKISQIIRGNNYESLKAAFDKEINRSQVILNEAKKLEKKYSDDTRFKRKRQAWETHISLCEDQFFAVLKDIFKPDTKTTIQASTVAELREEYRRRTKIIDERLKILSELSKQYQRHDTSDLVSALNNARQQFRDALYKCPEHKSFCKKCISQKKKCKACGGKGKWERWPFTYTCQLCRGTGSIYAPGRTYCSKCNGLWDKWINCKNCKKSGLVPCPSHNTDKTICPSCGTAEGDLSGQSLEQ